MSWDPWEVLLMMGGPGHRWGAGSSIEDFSVPVLNWLLGSKHPVPLSSMEHWELLGGLRPGVVLEGAKQGRGGQ